MKKLTIAWFCLFGVAGGCASHSRPAARVDSATRPSGAGSHAVTEAALLPLDQITPVPVLLPGSATTHPAEPSLDSIQLYAQARAAALEGNRAETIRLLKLALQKDPSSYELHEELGTAYLGSGSGNELALETFLDASRIEPNHIVVQLQLGRLYLSRNNLSRAIEHLRLALQTTEYETRPDMAALVNFFLARALQQRGYDTAALEQYDILLARMENGLGGRGNYELYHFLSRPETLYAHAGDLAAKHGHFAQALVDFKKALGYEPSNFDYSARVVRAMLGLGQFNEARNLAAELVRSFRASGPSLDLLKEVFRSQGREKEMVSELRKIHASYPADRSITFALADALASAGQTAQAERILLEAMDSSNAAASVVSRLFDFYTAADQTPKAARLVIEALGRRPEALSDFEPLFVKLGRGMSKNRLRLTDLQGLEVPDWAAASKDYWVSRLAEALDRQSVARSALERAIGDKPPFPPAYRALLSDELERSDWSPAQKNEQSQKLIDRARSGGNSALALELQGLRALKGDEYTRAIDDLRDSIRLGAKSPDTHFALAMALFAAGKSSQGEQALWKVISDFPSYDNAYMTLFRRYLNSGGDEGARQAVRVLQTWLAADPFSPNARLLQVAVFIQTGRSESAEQALLALFADDPENPAVVEQLSGSFAQAGKPGELQHRLEDEIRRHPANRIAAAALIRSYVATNHAADAARVLTDLRSAVAQDPEELYFVSHLYELIDQSNMTEQVLQQVLQLDPRHAPASNDLGYMWADDGKDLDKAEMLIRQAVEVEPDNSAYLDSLGWVLYKRGKFDDARKFLEQAISGGDRPDPVVLDHLGDALYRLDHKDDALRTWRKSLDRLAETPSDRQDLAQLRLQLKQKIQQQEAGRPVTVAPLALGK